MNDQPEMEWCHCNQCLRSTRHDVIASRFIEEKDPIADDVYLHWRTTYTMLECRGCGAVALRRRLECAEINEDSSVFYPPPISRQIPQWHWHLPNEFKSLLKEVYAALQADSHQLALMGARALIDLFMNKAVGDKGSFKDRLQELVKVGYLSDRQLLLLEPALDAGHAATHRGHNPNKDDLNLVFDIVENLIQTLVLEKKIGELKKNTPKRPKS